MGVYLKTHQLVRLSAQVPCAALLGVAKLSGCLVPVLYDLARRKYHYVASGRLQVLEVSELVANDFPDLVGLQALYENRPRLITEQLVSHGQVCFRFGRRNGRALVSTSAGPVSLQRVWLCLPRPRDENFIPFDQSCRAD